MTIELINMEQYDKILGIQEKHDVLTFENKGYEYIKTPFGVETKKAVKEIEEILNKHIMGFVSFTNFRVREDKGVQIRFQYNYGADDDNGHAFTGVGYIYLKTLLNGFKDNG